MLKSYVIFAGSIVTSEVLNLGYAYTMGNVIFDKQNYGKHMITKQSLKFSVVTLAKQKGWNLLFYAIECDVIS
jgi:hypothetical protein